MAISAAQLGAQILRNLTVKKGTKYITGAECFMKNQRTTCKDDLELIKVLEEKANDRFETPGKDKLPEFMKRVYKFVEGQIEKQKEDEESETITEEQFWEDYVCDFLHFESFHKVTLRKPADFDFLSSADVGNAMDLVSLKTFVKKLYISMDEEYTMPYDLATIIGDMERALPFYSNRKRNKLFEELKCAGNTDDSNLRKMLADLKVDNVEADVKILKHMIWAVKRRALRLPIHNEVFPVFVGKPGTGKSTTVIRLGSTLGEFFKEMQLQDLKEDRDNAKTSNQTNFMLFDEMAGADKQDINKLKRWVTAEEQGVRLMGTNGRSFYEKVAQGVGTSNSALRSILKDPTGNRRFFEIKVGLQENESPEWMDTVEFPDMDSGTEFWYNIWKNVDEQLPHGYWNPQEDKEILELMAKCVLPSSVKLWAEVYMERVNAIVSADEDPEDYIIFQSLGVLWEDFLKFEKNERIYFNITRDMFNRECREVLADIHPAMKPDTKITGGNSTYGFLVVDKDKSIAKKTAPKFAERG